MERLFSFCKIICFSFIVGAVSIGCNRTKQQQKNAPSQDQYVQSEITQKKTTQQDHHTKDTSHVDTEKIFYTPYLNSKVAIPHKQYSIKAEQGAIIKHQNGTTIHVPPSALCYKDGKPVIGEVSISFREMHDAVDIAASHVSMLLDTFNNNPRYLETAGMMEIQALQGNEKLYLKPDTYIEVRMPFSSMHSDYKVYNFDYTQNKWRLASRKEGYIEEMHKDTVKKYYSKIEEETESPVAEQSNFYFQLEVDTEQYPELKKYKSIAWVFAGKDNRQNVEYNQWVLKRAWNDVKLTPLKDGTYKMVFIGYDNTTFTTIVQPKEKKEITKTKRKKQYVESRVIRNYHWIIHQLGLWNCGRVYDNNNSIYLLSNFVFNKPCKPKGSIYFIDSQNKVVIDYPNPTKKQNRLISLEENGKFVAITEDNKLFIGKIEKSEKSKIKTLHSYTFTMNWIADSVMSTLDIRKHLYTHDSNQL